MSQDYGDATCISSTVDVHRVRGNWLGSRRHGGLAGANVEPAGVPWAIDLATVQRSIAQRPASVGALLPYRVKLPFHMGHHYVLPVNLGDQKFALWHILCFADRHKFAHRDILLNLNASL